MQEMLLKNVKGRISSKFFKEEGDRKTFHQFFQTTRTELEKVRLTHAAHDSVPLINDSCQPIQQSN